jgi:hypothetical protein
MFHKIIAMLKLEMLNALFPGLSGGGAHQFQKGVQVVCLLPFKYNVNFLFSRSEPKAAVWVEINLVWAPLGAIFALFFEILVDDLRQHYCVTSAAVGFSTLPHTTLVFSYFLHKILDGVQVEIFFSSFQEKGLIWKGSKLQGVYCENDLERLGLLLIFCFYL